MLETVRSLGSAPTLVEGKEAGMAWKSIDIESPPVSPVQRVSSATLGVGAQVVAACRLRGIEDEEEEMDPYRYHGL